MKRERERERYRLFPGAPVLDLASDVSVGTPEESGQTTTTTTARGLVSNLRRIYPRKASRHLLPASSTCREGSALHDNLFRQTAAGKSPRQQSFITGAHIRARARLIAND